LLTEVPPLPQQQQVVLLLLLRRPPLQERQTPTPWSKYTISQHPAASNNYGVQPLLF